MPSPPGANDAPPLRSMLVKLVLLGAGTLAVVVGLVLLLTLGGDEEVAPPAAPDAAPRRARTRPDHPSPPTSGKTRPDRDAKAKRLYDDAVEYEQANLGETREVMRRYRDVFLMYPGTGWAKMAEEKFRAADSRAVLIRDKEYEVILESARTLAAAGHFEDAAASLRDYVKEDPEDPRRRRAAGEAVAIENESRAAFNDAAAAAEELAKGGKYREAAGLFEAVKKGAIKEVATRCDVALGELGEAIAKQGEVRTAGAVMAAHDAFRTDEAPGILALVRARRYADALQKFDAAAKNPAYAGVADSLEAERAAVATGSAFWRGFRQALQSKHNKPVSLRLTDGTRIAGVLSRIEPYRIFVRTGELFKTVGLEQIHPDVIVAWTVGPVLPAGSAETSLQAALFFFCDGREDLARLYFATTKEKGVDLAAIEPIYRQGYLRAAIHAATKPKEAEPEKEE